jgi:hypothetical protein
MHQSGVLPIDRSLRVVIYFVTQYNRLHRCPRRIGHYSRRSIVSVSKKVYMYMCPIPNGFRDRAISLYTVQASNMPCPDTSCKVHWCWQNFWKCITLGKHYQLCHLNNKYRSGHSSWLQIKRSLVRFPALPDFLRSSGSRTGSTQPHEYNWGATWMEK